MADAALNASAEFEAAYGRAPLGVWSAPGRVNLIGEHTDYHEGFVLPTVIPQRTRVAVRPRGDSVVRARSGAVPESEAVGEYTIGQEMVGRGWLDYVQGVTSTLTRHDLAVSAFDVQIQSSIPIGAGVSSSAALEVSLLRALRTMFHLPLDDLRLAQERDALLDCLEQLPGTLVLVSNETGLGVVPMGELTRRYVDLAGTLHQAVAERCQRVVLTVAGLPLMLKGPAL